VHRDSSNTNQKKKVKIQVTTRDGHSRDDEGVDPAWLKPITMECWANLSSVGREDVERILEVDPRIVPGLEYERVVGREVWLPRYQRVDCVDGRDDDDNDGENGDGDEDNGGMQEDDDGNEDDSRVQDDDEMGGQDESRDIIQDVNKGSGNSKGESSEVQLGDIVTTVSEASNNSESVDGVDTTEGDLSHSQAPKQDTIRHPLEDLM
jgi:hypothetical protein